MTDLLVVGDANPDLVLRGGDVVPAFGQREQLVDDARALVLGGSGAIVACGAARLGLRGGDGGAASATTRSAASRATRLRRRGRGRAAVQVAGGEPTGVSVGLVRDDDRAILTAPGALARARRRTPCRTSCCAAARHVHVASPFLQPLLAAGARDLIARAHAWRATTSLDPGWDPAERWALPPRALDAVDVLLPNAEEAVRLASGAERCPRRRRALAAAGPSVALKLGAEGAAAFAGDERVGYAAPRGRCRRRHRRRRLVRRRLHRRLARRGGRSAAALALGVRLRRALTRAAGGTAAQPTLAEARALA